MEMFSGSHLWSQMKKKNLIDIERRRIIEKNVREIKEKEELDKLTAALEVNNCFPICLERSTLLSQIVIQIF